MLGRRIQKPPESFNPPLLPLDQCLVKSRKTYRGDVLLGRLVFSHCHIVGEVARAIMMRMPDWLRAELFPDGAELIASAHDIWQGQSDFQEENLRPAIAKGCDRAFIDRKFVAQYQLRKDAAVRHIQQTSVDNWKR